MPIELMALNLSPIPHEYAVFNTFETSNVRSGVSDMRSQLIKAHPGQNWGGLSTEATTIRFIRLV